MSDVMRQESTDRYVIVGHTEDGEICLLETVDIETEEIRERLRYWRKESNSRPYHYGVCVAYERTDVTLMKVVNA